MNIITDRWIPVLRRSGIRDFIKPADIADLNDPPQSLLWPRPDFNLACLELLIGLVYAAMPPEDDDEYQDTVDSDLYLKLNDRLDLMAPWFNLDGDGPRFMQALEPISGSMSDVDMLLLDSAGGKTAKDNADMMVRRNRYSKLGRPTAAMALYTLQNFAPTGGAGHRTSMRGGGPLVTLVEPCAGASLWQIIYANTPPGQAVDKENAHSAFPWLSATVNSKTKGSEIHSPERSDDSTPWVVFFGMPRQLRLEFESTHFNCEMTGVSDETAVVGVIQKPCGNNYGVWRHPCSPYYRVKAGDEALPVHPKPGRFGYRQYVGISLQDSHNELRYLADCVRRFRDVRGRTTTSKPLLRLIVGGWAMDNMKPVDFVDGYSPLPTGSNASEVEAMAISLVKAADICSGQLVGCLKRALLIDVSDKGTVAETRAEFYNQTEPDFQRALNALLSDYMDQTVRKKWQLVLERYSILLFDRSAVVGIEDRKPERADDIVAARKSLLLCLKGYGKKGVELYNYLGLQPPEPSKSKKRKTDTEQQA